LREGVEAGQATSYRSQKKIECGRGQLLEITGKRENRSENGGAHRDITEAIDRLIGEMAADKSVGKEKENGGV